MRNAVLSLVCGTLAGVLAGCAGPGGGPALQDQSSLRAAHAALDEGQAATALGIARGVLSMKPHDAAALVAAGNADIALHSRRAAEDDFRAALAADPGNLPARLGLAKLDLADDAPRAERALLSVLRDAPRDPAVLTDLGVALDLQERHQAAQARYMAALAEAPGLMSARVDLAVSLALTGQAEQAATMLRDGTDGLSVAPKIRADFALAEVLAGHSEDALRTLQPDLSPEQAEQSVLAMEELRPAPAAR